MVRRKLGLQKSMMQRRKMQRTTVLCWSSFLQDFPFHLILRARTTMTKWTTTAVVAAAAVVVVAAADLAAAVAVAVVAGVGCVAVFGDVEGEQWQCWALLLGWRRPWQQGSHSSTRQERHSSL